MKRGYDPVTVQVLSKLTKKPATATQPQRNVLKYFAIFKDVVHSLEPDETPSSLIRLQTMYNVHKFSKKWWNYVKKSFFSNRNATQRNRNFCQFNNDQYCIQQHTACFYSWQSHLSLLLCDGRRTDLYTCSIHVLNYVVGLNPETADLGSLYMYLVLSVVPSTFFSAVALTSDRSLSSLAIDWNR